MTEEQMVAALKSVGADFAVSTAKYLSPDDPQGAKPAYHIHPNPAHPHARDVVRVATQAQLRDWVQTMRAARRASEEDAQRLWMMYQDRWSK